MINEQGLDVRLTIDDLDPDRPVEIKPDLSKFEKNLSDGYIECRFCGTRQFFDAKLWNTDRGAVNRLVSVFKLTHTNCKRT